MPVRSIKKQFTLGACGSDCGLCPRFYIRGATRCPGCGAEGSPHCTIAVCAAERRGMETCALCGEFPCAKLEKMQARWEHRNGGGPHPRRVHQNLQRVKEQGLPSFLVEQQSRIQWLKAMLKSYDDGRSRSFFCACASLLSHKSLKASLLGIERRIREERVSREDIKGKVRLARNVIEELGRQEGLTFMTPHHPSRGKSRTPHTSKPSKIVLR